MKGFLGCRSRQARPRPCPNRTSRRPRQRLSKTTPPPLALPLPYPATVPLARRPSPSDFHAVASLPYPPQPSLSRDLRRRAGFLAVALRPSRRLAAPTSSPSSSLPPLSLAFALRLPRPPSSPYALALALRLPRPLFPIPARPRPCLNPTSRCQRLSTTPPLPLRLPYPPTHPLLRPPSPSDFLAVALASFSDSLAVSPRLPRVPCRPTPSSSLPRLSLALSLLSVSLALASLSDSLSVWRRLPRLPCLPRRPILWSSLRLLCLPRRLAVSLPPLPAFLSPTPFSAPSAPPSFTSTPAPSLAVSPSSPRLPRRPTPSSSAQAALPPRLYPLGPPSPPDSLVVSPSSPSPSLSPSDSLALRLPRRPTPSPSDFLAARLPRPPTSSPPDSLAIPSPSDSLVSLAPLAVALSLALAVALSFSLSLAVAVAVASLPDSFSAALRRP